MLSWSGGTETQGDDDVSWLEEICVAQLPAVEVTPSAASGVDAMVQELVGLPLATDVTPTVGGIGAYLDAPHTCPFCHEQHPRISRFWGKLGYDGPAYCWRCAESFKLHMLTRKVQNNRICQRDKPCLRCATVLAHFRVASEDIFAAVDCAAAARPREQAGAASDGSGSDNSCARAVTLPLCPFCNKRVHAGMGLYWRKIGYRGPAYCSGCSNTFRNHLIRRRGQRRTCCSCKSPCDICRQILEHFEGTDYETIFQRVDSAKQRATRRASERRGALDEGSHDALAETGHTNCTAQDAVLGRTQAAPAAAALSVDLERAQPGAYHEKSPDAGKLHHKSSAAQDVVLGRTKAAPASAALSVGLENEARLGCKRQRLRRNSAPSAEKPCDSSPKTCAATVSAGALIVALVSLVGIGGTATSTVLPERNSSSDDPVVPSLPPPMRQDPCSRSPSPCHNGGTCLSEDDPLIPAGYLCICDGYFGGSNCEISLLQPCATLDTRAPSAPTLAECVAV